MVTVARRLQLAVNGTRSPSSHRCALPLPIVTVPNTNRNSTGCQKVFTTPQVSPPRGMRRGCERFTLSDHPCGLPPRAGGSINLRCTFGSGDRPSCGVPGVQGGEDGLGPTYQDRTGLTRTNDDLSSQSLRVTWSARLPGVQGREDGLGQTNKDHTGQEPMSNANTNALRVLREHCRP